MKKAGLFFIALNLFFICFSQKTISSADFGSIGDSAIMAIDSNFVGELDFGISGDSVRWEFDFLQANQFDTLLFVDPSTISGGDIGKTNLVMKTQFLNVLWEKTNNKLGNTAIGFEFDFALIDTADSVRTVYIEYSPSIANASFLMEFGDYNELLSEGIVTFDLDSFALDSASGVYVDSARLIDNVEIFDSINGSGTVFTPSDTIDCLRQDIRINHTYTIEVLVPFGPFAFWVPITDYFDIGIPPLKERFIRYWARGKQYPVLEFSLDSNEAVTQTQFLYNPKEYIDGIKEVSSQIAIFPNPTNSVLTIQAQKPLGTMKITDALGKTILEKRSLDTTEQIDVSPFQKGIYYISSEWFRGKFVKD